MTSNLFHRQNHAALGHVNSLHPVSKCGNNKCTKSANGLRWRDQPTIISGEQRKDGTNTKY